MRYLVLVILMLVALSFAGITAVPTAVSIDEGGVVPIKLSLTGKDGNPTSGTVSAEFDAGGFEELDLIFGMKINKEATVHYIAPMIDGQYTINFLYNDEAATTIVTVQKQEITGQEATAQVVQFKGSVAYKAPDSEVWEPVANGLVLKEGYSLLTVGKSYAVIEFPNKSQTKILEDTQLKIEKLRKVSKGYAIVLKQYKGKTYNTVAKLLSSGEKFLIKTDSVTAGVRGTRFAVIEEKNGFRIETFEGVVFAYFRSGKVVPVPAGKEVSPEGKLGPLTHEEEEFYPEKREEKIPGTTGGSATAPEKKGVPESGVTKANLNSMYIGTMNKEGEDYLVYSFGLNLDFGPVGFEVGITAYSTEIGGNLYYGLPSSEPSTNLIDAITLNAFRLKLDGFSLRYGKGGSYTLGMGYTMRRYTIPYGNTLDVSYSTGKFWISAHFPYEIRKISDFDIEQSDPLYFGEIGVNIGGIDLSLAGVYDSSASTSSLASVEPVRYAAILSAKRELFGDFALGAELSGLVGASGTIAWGGFAGLYGSIWILDVVAGPYANGAGFAPLIFTQGYSSDRFGISVGKGLEMGYMAGMEFKQTWGEGRIYLNGSFGSSEPTLDGYLRGILPRFATFPAVEVSGYIHDPTPLQGVMDSDTSAWFSIATLVGGGYLKAGTRFIWDGSEWKSEVFVTGVSM